MDPRGECHEVGSLRPGSSDVCRSPDWLFIRPRATADHGHHYSEGNHPRLEAGGVQVHNREPDHQRPRDDPDHHGGGHCEADGQRRGERLRVPQRDHDGDRPGVLWFPCCEGRSDVLGVRTSTSTDISCRHVHASRGQGRRPR